ncbi:RNA-directed DNA polymerase [Deefgea rivuli]|uniref:RNA-directed DNA polymerase n=1 Tax=Deefgea rivuli TaxID=400948 RepID=UPI00048A38EB|nr:RNA-directed DNA polymerase [Deefgea rivuli]
MTRTIAEILFGNGEISDSALFESLFAPATLYSVFEDKHATSTSKGIDRINGFQFFSRAEAEFVTTSKKCIAGTYYFAPYLEVLKAKGRNKLPRLIGIPTIRDRVILAQLNRFLAAVFPECIPRNIASTYVRSISEDLQGRNPDDTWVCCTDIKTFYDSIERDRLITVLEKKIHSNAALRLIRHALLTPTVPKNTKRNRHADYKTATGVPQGLAISNILAAIYMQPIDEAMKQLDVNYYRYVDDVIMYGDHDSVKRAKESLTGRLKRRGLSLHATNSGKTQVAQLSRPFGYLGYFFEGTAVTVREATIERFLQSIAAKFSDFTHNKKHRLDKHKYLTEERLADIFLLELNERITGAISGQKRYGWIAYFSQITDLSLLHKIDHTIRGLFSRLPEFDFRPPADLKTLRRSYWEMRHNSNGGYVRNYDAITTREEKLAFLEQRGRLDPDETLTDEQIDDKYARYVRYILSTMHADEGAVYG